MSALLEGQLLGRTVRILGITDPIDLTVGTTTYPIFNVGDVKNRAPEGITHVAFVGIEYNDGSGTAPDSLTWRIGNASTIASSGSWKGTFNADAYSTNPTIIYATDQEDTLASGSVFAIRVQTAGASGTAIATAYGWTS